jgi:membrane protein DedA with SNARE-associated domain
MSAYLQQLLEWIALNPLWAGIVIFVIAMIESLAIIGALVPGVIMLFGAGALIGNGTLGFWSSFCWAVAGAILGDNLSYWLGRHYEQRMAGSRWFALHPAQLDKALRFVERHGGMSVAFGRFFGPLRAIVPLAAGLLHMAPSHFLIANVLSALVWAPAYLLPGMVFGASLELAGPVSLRLGVIILLLGALFFGLFKLLRPLIMPQVPRYALSALLLALPLAGLCYQFDRDIGAQRPPNALDSPLLGLSSTQLIEQGWRPLPPCHWADLLKLLSPAIAIEGLPPGFGIGERQAWVRALDGERRQLLVLGPQQAWLLEQRVRDYLLMRLPVLE